MRQLQFPFRKNGWTHELVRREGLVLLVRRSKNGGSAHFEVVVLRERKPITFKKNGSGEISMPYREVYPGSEDWGTYGFTYRSLDTPERGWTALSRFESLVKKYAGRPALVEKEVAPDGG